MMLEVVAEKTGQVASPDSTDNEEMKVILGVLARNLMKEGNDFWRWGA
mgnify:CR=1 FL=1